ncbi:MAG TPA: TonB-dependent receptor [Burkholderiaceae bacterium]|nr:TonB-dependent receptor [Burkholderiaceae bacterium]HQR71420.1 TonB-dependent receptor [Burkholderiaceae bacterium]
MRHTNGHGDGAGARRAAVALCAMGLPAAWAQTPAEGASAVLERVEITGSHIRQTDAEGSLPVQIIRREEIERSGVTTVEQLLERVPANVNPFNVAQTIGNGLNPGLSSANLRGLGGGSTLVLLNGRRLGNYAFDGASVDLNSIPLAAIERVEVLKDGASAIYGTDAIAGVINFILRKDFQGVEVAGGFTATQHGGGNEGQIAITGGIGDPARDGYNLFASLAYQKQQVLRSIDRDYASTAYRPDQGLVFVTPLVFPSNIFDRTQGRILNPTAAEGCRPPTAIPIQYPDAYAPACGYDYAAAVDLLPEVERTSALVRGTWRPGPDLDLFAEVLLGRNRFVANIAPNPIAPFTSFGQLRYPAGGAYYPTVFAAANGLSGNLLISYRATELGPRTNTTTSDTQRYVVGVEGRAAGWDYNVAAVYNANQQENSYGGSFVYAGRIIPAMATGLINPWGPSGPQGLALLASTVYSGTPQTAHGTTSLINGYASRDVLQLPSGPFVLAFGAEARRESLSYEWDPEVLSGNSPIGDQLVSISGSRTVYSAYAELAVPIVRGLDAQLAVRFDDYSDFGSTTNPKIALRWQPLQSLVVRGSWGEGFRAPPLYTLSAPTTASSVDVVEDPIRCPATGLVDDCLGFVQIYSGGNPNLQPETSTQWNLGFVWEPLRGFATGLDYWNIEQKGIIEPLTVENILRYHERFTDRIIRGPVDPSTPTLPGPIVAIDASPANLGTTQTSGFDVFVSWLAPTQPWGQVRIGLQGTYVWQWETQIDGVNYVSRLGDGTYGNAIPRWRSTLTFDWNRGPWGATLAQVYSSGYTEPLRQLPSGTREVGSSSTWDLQGRYTGFSGWQLALGVRNLFDTDPPFSVPIDAFQIGFSPLVASPLGRAFYLRAAYSFR